MPNFKHLKEGNNRYLLMPTMPTPNGGLHLGHISGPYLKMDVMARAQRRNGNHVSIMFGSDVYESYTTLKAWQTGDSIESVCDQYHQQISHDLHALNIVCDAYINPLDSLYRDRFDTFLKNFVQELVNKQAVKVMPEKYLYCPEEDCYLVGCWILGKCPVCKADTGSYQCESCGTHYRPMDIIDPVFRRGDYVFEDVEDYALYLDIRKKQELMLHLKKMGFPSEFLEIAETYFLAQGDRIRITNPDKWGTPWKMEGSKVPQVLFTYTALYFFSLFCGELYAEKFNLPFNAFHPDSGIITIASFGIDCSIPYMVAAVGCGIESGIYKPMDYLLPNHFLKLENEKFSTSRGHAIWASDIIDKTPASADAVRYFLVWNNPDNEMRDFRINEFIEFVNSILADDLQNVLLKNYAMLDGKINNTPPDEMTAKLEELLIIQNRYLRPPYFKLKDSCLPLQEWINLNNMLTLNAQNAYWWLKGFALIAYPVMPDCATSIWHLLGHSGEPLEVHYFEFTSVDIQNELPEYFSPISYDKILPVLPETLLKK